MLEERYQESPLRIDSKHHHQRLHVSHPYFSKHTKASQIAELSNVRHTLALTDISMLPKLHGLVFFYHNSFIAVTHTEPRTAVCICSIVGSGPEPYD